MEMYSPYSELKIFSHTDRIDGLLNGKRVAPVYVRIKPTNVCNQNCFYCVYANDLVYDGRTVDQRESIPWDIMERTLCELPEMGVKALTFSGGGAPLCYHSIVPSLKLAQKLGMDCSMITNGQALSGEAAELLCMAKWIRVSFDACSADTYRNTRNIPTFDQVVQNIGDFAKKKGKGCTLGINCVVTRQNADEIYDICKLAKELGADNIKLSPIMVKEEEADYHESIQEKVKTAIARAKEELADGTFHIVDKYSDDMAMEEHFCKPYRRCAIQELFAVIAADAKVYRCHQRAYTKEGELGDLTKQSFREIWYSTKTVTDVRDYDARKKCQFRCAFDERNMLLDSFLGMDRNHINFI